MTSEEAVVRHGEPYDPICSTERFAANERRHRCLSEIGATFQRLTVYQLKIGDLSFYPGRGTIFRDGSPAAMTEKGLDALLCVIKSMEPKPQSTILVVDGPKPARANYTAPIGSRPPYGKRRFS
jgi:hypothetical protein